MEAIAHSWRRRSEYDGYWAEKTAAGFSALGDENPDGGRLVCCACRAADPVITVPWTASGDDGPKCRFVDLRLEPHLIDEIEEARARPALRSALLLLNGAGSQLWTAKCDAWTSSAEQGDDPFDPYEMDAEPGETAFGAGSYIDLLPRDFEASRVLRYAGAMAARGDRETARHTGEARRGWNLSCGTRRSTPCPGFGVTLVRRGVRRECAAAPEQGGAEAFHAALAVIMDVRLE